MESGPSSRQYLAIPASGCLACFTAGIVPDLQNTALDPALHLSQFSLAVRFVRRIGISSASSLRFLKFSVAISKATPCPLA
jgi:hypothetical protein